MSEPAPPSALLRRERQADWLELERLLDRVERGSLRGLSDEDLLALPVLYRAALSSLSVARATVLDAALVDYLEALCARAYFAVYGARDSLWRRIGRFFLSDWPAAAQALWRETLAAWACLLVGFAAALLLVSTDPEWFSAFISTDMAAGRDPAASTGFLRESLGGEGNGVGLLSVFSSYLFTHNGQVAIFAFALGFSLCVPTALLLAYSGAGIGAFVALFASRGLGLDLGGWLAVHGVTEITAVVLAGAGGFHIGTAVVAPGRRGRLDAATIAGKRAVILLVGTLIMLACAGLLEGIVRQVVVDTRWRYLIALGTGLFWMTYLYGWRRRARPEGA